LPRQFWVMNENMHAVFNLVPFAGTRRQVTDSDGHAEFVGKQLQFALPQSQAWAVATAAIGGNERSAGIGIARASHVCHQRRIALTAKLAVSWSMPTLTQPVLPAIS
jgi:hypothetical protein